MLLRFLHAYTATEKEQQNTAFHKKKGRSGGKKNFSSIIWMHDGQTEVPDEIFYNFRPLTSVIQRTLRSYMRDLRLLYCEMFGRVVAGMHAKSLCHESEDKKEREKERERKNEERLLFCYSIIQKTNSFAGSLSTPNVFFFALVSVLHSQTLKQSTHQSTIESSKSLKAYTNLFKLN